MTLTVSAADLSPDITEIINISLLLQSQNSNQLLVLVFNGTTKSSSELIMIAENISLVFFLKLLNFKNAFLVLFFLHERIHL